MATKNETISLATEIIFGLLKELVETRENLIGIRDAANEEITRLDKIIEVVEK